MKSIPRMLLLLMVLPLGCSLLDPDEGTLSLETDRKLYGLDAEEVIEVEAQNISSSVIYFNTCMPTSLEELDGGRVVATLAFPVCECICINELEPGESWRHSVHVVWIVQHKDRLTWGEGNEYRLKLTAFYEDGEFTLMDEEVLYTNRFRLSE